MATYACSDLHGCYSLYEQITQDLQLEDTVYFLGDAGDRGPDSYKTICAILDNPQFIYLKGNHEDMLIKCMEAYLQADYTNPAFDVLKGNKGRKTFLEWTEDPNYIQRYEQLRQLEYIIKYINIQGQTIILTHAGFTPKVNTKIPSEHDLLWDRTHMDDDWDEAHFKDVLIVHGHTPIQSFLSLQTQQDISKYAGGHKIDIDNASFLTGKIVLLDLDWFDIRSYYDEKITLFGRRN